jgi:phosphoglycolate phosphatase
MINAVIFDFDGTLTELTLDFSHLRAEVVAIARKYVAEETIRMLDGFYVIEMIYELERTLGSQGGPFGEEAFARLTSLELESAADKSVFPFTREVLGTLNQRGVKTGIVTRSCHEVLDLVFPDAPLYVDAVLAREDTRYPKPHPEHVREASRALGVPVEELLMVGDHPTDVISGREAGAQTAGVLSGRTTREAFQIVGALHIIDDIRGVLTII